MDGSCNRIYVAGEIVEAPTASHVCRGEEFCRLTLGARRLSGAVDELPLILPLSSLPPGAVLGAPLWARGQVRAYTHAVEGRARLSLSVFARSAGLGFPAHENAVELCGYVCKPPILRTTPKGRVLTDLFVACNRAFGRADYLPVIVWGANARQSAALQVGDFIRVTGRLQSRSYEKLQSDGQLATRTICEISGAAERIALA